MNRLLLAAVLVAVAGLPSITVAQTSGPPMDPKTIICRPSAPGEQSNATIKKTPVMCHKVNVARVTAALNEIAAMPLSSSQRARVNTAMAAMKTEITLPPAVAAKKSGAFAPGTNHIPGFYDTSEY